MTVGQGANGDLYAGHNGNVYKKTDDGWQSYDRDNGSWNQVPERQGTNPQPTAQSRETGQLGSSASVYGPSDPAQSSRITQSGSRDYSQLNRDAAARQGGTSSFQRNRASGAFGGGSRSMGARPRRR
jgi:hypothetical protein